MRPAAGAYPRILQPGWCRGSSCPAGRWRASGGLLNLLRLLLLLLLLLLVLLAWSYALPCAMLPQPCNAEFYRAVQPAAGGQAVGC
jgi:hypothetical protein